ncbi:MAG TPA: flagellinolysin [Symbiobacteriaceae bacterium]|nr:flagellinolysin [Symbiobacteriaceae bacterium]
MAAYGAPGISPFRIDRPYGVQPRTAGQSQRQAPAPQAAARPSRSDEAAFSAGGLALNRLVRMWGSLSSLFGTAKAPGWHAPDLSALREALVQARQNAEAVELRQRVTGTLKSSALRQAEVLVEQYYGLKGDGTTVKVKYDESMEGALASVSFQYDSRGRIVSPQLHINMSQFTPDTGPNGVNDHVIENDRIVAHEMTHLIMGRNMDLASLPDWFAEGTAEYVAGGAERVALSLRRLSPRRLLAKLNGPWNGDSDSYAAGYLAVRFLDQAAAAGGGLKAVMARLKDGDTLDQAVATASQGRFESTADFLSDFTSGAGLAFMGSIDLSGRDPGSIKPARAPEVIADGGVRSDQPLRGFRIQWPSPLEGLPALGPASSYAMAGTPAGAALAYRRRMPGAGSDPAT